MQCNVKQENKFKKPIGIMVRLAFVLSFVLSGLPSYASVETDCGLQEGVDDFHGVMNINNKGQSFDAYIALCIFEANSAKAVKSNPFQGKRMTCYFKNKKSELEPFARKYMKEKETEIEKLLTEKKIVEAKQLLASINPYLGFNADFISSFYEKYNPMVEAKTAEATKSNALSAEMCEANLYKDCYKGISWGTEIDDTVAEALGCFSKQGAKKRNLLTYDFALDRTFIQKEEMQQRIDIQVKANCNNLGQGYYLCLVNNAPLSLKTGMGFDALERYHPDAGSCKAIIFQNKLVGFWFKDKNPSDDDYLFIKGSMKKKYGKNLIETKGNDWTNGSVVWSDVNGLNIHLERRSNSGSIDIQYIKLNVLNNILTSLEEKAVKDKEKSKTEEINKKNDLVKGL